MPIIWFCYAVAFAIAAFGMAILWLLARNTRLHEDNRRSKMEIEAMKEAVQYLWENRGRLK